MLIINNTVDIYDIKYDLIELDVQNFNIEFTQYEY